MSQPIFYDPKNKRWKYFRTTLQVSGLIFTIIFGIALVSILINPLLPSLGLKPINGLPKKHHLQIPDNKPFIMSYRQKTFQDERKKLDKSIESNKILVKSRKAKNQVNTIGFFVNWDDTSGTSLKQNIDKLDILIPEWVHLRGADGKVEFDDLAKQKRVTTYIRQHQKDLKIMPLINNFKSENENWNTNVLKNMLKSEVSRQKLIDNLFDYITSNNYAGINVDFESVDDPSQKNLIIFMKELTQKFHTKNLKVSECVPLDDPAFDYKTLAKYNDYLVLMAYDEHWSTSDPGPIASQKWYANLIAKRFAEVSAEKIIVAIGNYGYDWNKKNKSATTVSFQEALTIARESGSKINFDGKSLNPNFDYYDDNDSLHHVWFLDATTVFNQLSEAYQYLPYGFALWRMGSEDPSMWQIFDFDTNNQFDEKASKKIEKIHYDYDIIYEGKGEVLRITSTPKDGDRKVYYDKDSEVILDAKYNSSPSPYVITRFGGNNKKEIAITFDDGPDADYTPDVLDILKKYNVPATFFVIGWNAESNQGLIKRIFHEGHEIGNHTFTHPNISLLPTSQVRLEINTTQRLIESILGRSTDLFRPPYAEDIEPNTADKIKPLAFTGDLGYYTIGMQIDPDDWATPGTNKIVSRVLEQLNNGNIILLHDSGGDRSQTVKALPTIIEELKKRGYTFVTVSKLLGLTRDQVMPKIAKNENSFARVNDIVFITISLLQISLYYFFIFGIALGIFRFIFIGLLAVIEANKKDNYPDDFKPTVSVIVPAYNEEKVINNTINSLLKSKYKNFDIIVVDDGSKDNTYQKVLDSFSNNIQVKAFTKENAGKSEAVNFGIRQTEAEIILCLDADTIFHPDAIGNLVRHFHNPKVGAVAGNVKIGNR
ncbi:MAG: polysaccharide deacetylase family protein, partial [Candidatus Sericytochromatia bacterium]|nr:polysaccharide deacetylase family protein [Candidatus Sericytochromatia bacterium]